jgi:hypothetical protein
LVNANTQTQPSTDVNPKHSLRIGTAEDGANTNIAFYLGTMQELDFYSPVASMSTLQSRRSPIESNINNYYQIYWQGTQQALLDQFGGSAAAFSLRNLSSSYRGPLVRVRRSSDNAETDIGGTFSGDLDVNSLLAFTGGQNLVLHSEDFTNASWIKASTAVTANATIAPDGTLTADKLTETAVNAYHELISTTTVTSNQHSLSFYAKAAERRYVLVIFYNTITLSNQLYTVFDLVNGVIVSNNTVGGGVLISSSIQNVGNGWYRCSITGNTNKTGSHNAQINTLASELVAPHLGVAGSGVYIWGAQLNTGILQPYIPTTTAAINGANAFVTKWYDQSGIGDNLVLQSETFDNASWVKTSSTVTANTIAAPDGTLTADTYFESTANSIHYTNQVVSSSSGVYTLSVYFKYINKKYMLLAAADGVANGGGVVFDIETGSFVGNSTTGAGYSILSYSITNASNGWYRYSVTLSTSGAPSPYIILRSSSSLSWSDSYIGNASVGVYMWGAQVSAGSELLRYQPTTTAAAPKRDAIQTTAASQPRIVNAGSVESENGKPSIFYDGSDDFLSLASTLSLLTSHTITSVSNNNNKSVSVLIGSTTPISNFNSDLEKFTYNANGVFAQLAGFQYGQRTRSILRNGTTSLSVYQNSIQYDLSIASNEDFTIKEIGRRADASTFNWLGGIQELTFYPTGLTSGLPTIESNTNSYYQIYWQGNGTALLDSFSGASAAYSLRNLSSAYTGPLIRVRRSSDNLERDIYGTFRGDLDLAALTSFVGANSGFVTTWYDQSGTGRHATQATAGSQPRIVNAGAVDTEGGKPTLFFDGTNDQLIHTIPSPIAATPYSVHTVVSSLTQSSYKGIFGLGDSLNTGLVINSRLAFSPNWGTYGSSDQPSTQSLQSAGIRLIEMYGTYSVGTHNYYTNGASSGTYNSTSGQSVGHIGGHAPANQFFNGDISEVIYYNADRTASRIPIESNINNYYKIY